MERNGQCFYEYEDFLEETLEFQKQYPEHILKIKEIGISYDNRKIFLFQVGTGNKKILFTAGVHGREGVNSIVCMKLIRTYCEALLEEQKEKNKQGELVNILSYQELKQYTFYFIPILNPDGYMIAQKGFHMIQNEVLQKQVIQISQEKNIPYTLWKFNAKGADINRDFPSKTWQPKNQGDYPGKQLETKALISVINEKDIDVYIDLHSRGNEIYYYRKEMSKEYNLKQLEYAKKMAELTEYNLVNPFLEIESGDSGGNTVHYFSEYKNNPAFTIETIEENASFPLDFIWQKDIYKRLERLFTVF